MSLRKSPVLRPLRKSSANLQSARWVRLVAAVLLPVLLISMIGVPLPVPPAKNLKERFPCENCPCSCSTAAACWDNCCCKTDEEKLVWAEQNGVKPPEFLVRRVAAKRKSAKEESPDRLAGQDAAKAKSTCSCCSKKAESSQKACANCPDNGVCEKSATCCLKAAKNSNSSNSECTVAKSCCSKIAKPTEAKSEAKKLKYVLLNSALNCKGIQLAVAIFSNCLPTQSLVLNIPQPMQIELLTIESEMAGSIFTLLDDPVPRG